MNDVRYLFYVTNDRTTTPEEIVFTCNNRCEQAATGRFKAAMPHLIEQLKNGPRSIITPVDNLYSNWAYMLMASLGWTLNLYLGKMCSTAAV
ncbi:MAG: hypothetical protein KDA91_21275 [Planctomycetaceae bacterium]|nr:hypothetical protein [Planctomycetaceae bacterium]